MIDKNNLPKLYVGAISKNTVDAAIEFSNNTGIPIGFCASRNQINGDKGYCNNWTTYDFVNYVREQNENIVIERDHASEITDDDSLFDIIHIDAFKNGNIVKDTSSIMMKNIPKEMLFEFGTEESRCPYSPDLLDIYIGYLQQLLTRNAWERFVYVVVQP